MGVIPDNFNEDFVEKSQAPNCELCQKSLTGLTNLATSRYNCYYCGISMCKKCFDKFPKPSETKSKKEIKVCKRCQAFKDNKPLIQFFRDLLNNKKQAEQTMIERSKNL